MFENIDYEILLKNLTLVLVGFIAGIITAKGGI